MANSKLHDDFVNEFEASEDVEASVNAMLLGLADRIEVSIGNVVKMTDLRTVLREDPDKVAKAVLANTEYAKNRTQTTSSVGAPSTAFEKPREGVRDGMGNSTNDHRDQQFPPNANTEAEREQIRREETARSRGAALVVNTDLPDVPASEKQAEADRAKAAKTKHR